MTYRKRASATDNTAVIERLEQENKVLRQRICSLEEQVEGFRDQAIDRYHLCRKLENDKSELIKQLEAQNQ